MHLQGVDVHLRDFACAYCAENLKAAIVENVGSDNTYIFLEHGTEIEERELEDACMVAVSNMGL